MREGECPKVVLKLLLEFLYNDSGGSRHPFPVPDLKNLGSDRPLWDTKCVQLQNVNILQNVLLNVNIFQLRCKMLTDTGFFTEIQTFFHPLSRLSI